MNPPSYNAMSAYPDPRMVLAASSDFVLDAGLPLQTFAAVNPNETIPTSVHVVPVRVTPPVGSNHCPY
jgi:hypothetical protein